MHPPRATLVIATAALGARHDNLLIIMCAGRQSGGGASACQRIRDQFPTGYANCAGSLINQHLAHGAKFKIKRGADEDMVCRMESVISQ